MITERRIFAIRYAGEWISDNERSQYSRPGFTAFRWCALIAVANSAEMIVSASQGRNGVLVPHWRA